MEHFNDLNAKFSKEKADKVNAELEQTKRDNVTHSVMLLINKAAQQGDYIVSFPGYVLEGSSGSVKPEYDWLVSLLEDRGFTVGWYANPEKSFNIYWGE